MLMKLQTIDGFTLIKKNAFKFLAFIAKTADTIAGLNYTKIKQK